MAKKESFQLCGYYPGVVGKITELHAVYYHENWGFDITFETQVGRELSDFMRGMEQGRDGFWSATVDGRFAGAVAIDGSLKSTEGARLRWFIVEPSFQGRGIGQALLRTAIRFCEETGQPKIFLWTFKGLDAARRLYEAEGFVLDEEHNVRQWGSTIREQKFILSLKENSSGQQLKTEPRDSGE
jgi:GNAT superfamily N-acetyltransferase